MRKFHYDQLFPIVLSIVAFYILAGFALINPSNIQWIPTGDPTINFISWDFYRYSDWTFPIGLNPDYGYLVSSSIVYSDLIPIMAIPFKLVSKYLSIPFQYLGLWHLICFILQALIAWKIFDLYSKDITIKILCSGILLFAPPFTTLLNITAGLQSHFLILGSFLILLDSNINNTRRYLFWMLLILSALCIQFYLFVMVLGMYFADLLQSVCASKSEKLSSALIKLSSIVIFVGIVAWQIGYFEVSTIDAVANGYGDISNKFNPLSFVLDTKLSYIQSTLPELVRHEDASANFLGTGMILGLIVVFTRFKEAKLTTANAIKKNKYLFLMLIFFMLIAITNKVSIGKLYFEFFLPDFILSKVSILRSSTRMFWPFFYAIYLAILILIIRLFTKKVALMVLAIILVTQIVDTSIWWVPMRQQITKPQRSPFEGKLSSPFWSFVPQMYKKIVRIPTLKYEVTWEILGKFSAEHHLKTNIVMLNRPNASKINLANSHLNYLLSNGAYEKDTLYILGDDLAIPARANLNLKSDLLAQIDGFTVIAPNWLQCEACPQIQPLFDESVKTPITLLNIPIKFSKNSEGTKFLLNIDSLNKIGYGWSFPESWGVWSEGHKAKLILPFPANALPQVLELRLKSISTKQVEIFCNGVPQKTIVLSPNKETLVDISLNSTEFENSNYASIEIRSPDFSSPKKLGLGDDSRPIGVGLISATFH